MMETNQILTILIGLLAVIGFVALVLLGASLLLKRTKSDNVLYAKVSDLKAYKDKKEKEEDFDECLRIQNLIEGKEDDEEVLLPKEYVMLEVGLMDRDLNISTRNLIFKLN